MRPVPYKSNGRRVVSPGPIRGGVGTGAVRNYSQSFCGGIVVVVVQRVNEMAEPVAIDIGAGRGGVVPDRRNAIGCEQSNEPHLAPFGGIAEELAIRGAGAVAILVLIVDRRLVQLQSRCQMQLRLLNLQPPF